MGPSRQFISVLIFVLTAATGAVAQGAAKPSTEWWVVLASIKDDGTMVPHQQIEALRKRMTACKIEMFNDFSAKFVGFSKGYLVAVTGPHNSEKAASSKLAATQICAPQAYVKRARYLGE